MNSIRCVVRLSLDPSLRCASILPYNRKSAAQVLMRVVGSILHLRQSQSTYRTNFGPEMLLTGLACRFSTRLLRRRIALPTRQSRQHLRLLLAFEVSHLPTLLSLHTGSIGGVLSSWLSCTRGSRRRLLVVVRWFALQSWLLVRLNVA